MIEWLNIAQASKYMGLGQGSVRKLVKHGYLYRTKPAFGPTLIKKEWIDKYLEKNKVNHVTIDNKVDKIVNEILGR